MASRSFEREQERRREEREQRRAEERAEQRREEELERRREEEREAEREEERRTESLARERELEAAEEREGRRRQDAAARRRQEAQAERRERDRRDGAREAQAQQRREADRAAERDRERRDEARTQRLDTDRDEERRGAARAERVDADRERDRDQERRESARTDRQAADRERDRDQQRREAARTDRQAADRERDRDEERREAARTDRQAADRERDRDQERRETARARQVDERRDAERAESEDAERRAGARAAEAERRRTAHVAGVAPAALPWLRVRGPLVVDERGTPVYLRGVALRGLERAAEEAGGFQPAADEDELAVIAGWGATAVLVPVAQDLILYGGAAAEPEAYLEALDATIEAAGSAGLYVLVQLALLSSQLPTAAQADADIFAPVLPDERSIDAWSLLARRYAGSTAVLFDLFRAPGDPLPGDSTGDLITQLRWSVWRRWLLAMLGEIRRAHPRALAIARGIGGGRDFGGFPLRYSDGSATPNVIYGAELGAGDPAPVLTALARVGRSHPVGVLGIRPGAADADALERLQQVLARAGWHWVVDAWREPATPLVLRRSPLRPTRLGTAVARGLAQPPSPDANLDRSIRDGAGGHPVLRMLAQLVPGQLPDAGTARDAGVAAAEPRSILVFYGYSGEAALPDYPDGVDTNQSFALVAKTIAATLRKAFPGDEVTVVQAWHKDKLIDALERAAHPIRQVHVACHGDSTRLSLSYHYDERFQHAVDTYNAMSGSDHARGLAALKAEDAIVAGFFKWGLEPGRLDRIAAAHAPGATWQIWGCFAGYPSDTLGDPGFTAAQNAYVTRMGLGFTTVDGIAVEIAKQLKVTCTAAVDEPGLSDRGLLFWHGTAAHAVEMNDNRTAARLPFWLWNNSGSKWVTYGPDGVARPIRIVLGAPHSDGELATGKPPRWLTDAFWK